MDKLKETHYPPHFTANCLKRLDDEDTVDVEFLMDADMDSEDFDTALTMIMYAALERYANEGVGAAEEAYDLGEIEEYEMSEYALQYANYQLVNSFTTATALLIENIVGVEHDNYDQNIYHDYIYNVMTNVTDYLEYVIDEKEEIDKLAKVVPISKYLS